MGKFLVIICFISNIAFAKNLAGNATEPQDICNVEEVELPEEFVNNDHNGTLYLAKAYQTPDCKTIVYASYKNGVKDWGWSRLIRYSSEGNLDKTYGPKNKGYHEIPVGKWTDQSPQTIDFIRYENRVYFYGLISDADLYGGHAYTFGVQLDGTFDKEALLGKTRYGVVYRYFGFGSQKGDLCKAFPAEIHGKQLKLKFHLKAYGGSYATDEIVNALVDLP